jgi:hypothetical protein
MDRRSVILTAVSLLAGLALIAALIAKAHVDPRDLLIRLRVLDRTACVRFALWMAATIYVSSVKWRLTDEVLRGQGKQPVGGDMAFASTAFGVAIGQVLPAQLSMPAARTLMTAGHGRALRRGTFGTLFEQSFDLLAVCVLAIPSIAIIAFHRGFGTWLALAVLISLGTVWMVGRLLNFLNNINVQVEGAVRWRRALANLQESGLMRGTLGFKLSMLAFARFAFVVLAAGETTAAIHAAVPLWYIVVAMPLVLLAMVTGITPGGIGIVEFAYVGMLHLFGIPLSVAAEWALAARILTVTSACVIAVSAAAFLMVYRIPTALRSIHAENSL